MTYTYTDVMRPNASGRPVEGLAATMPRPSVSQQTSAPSVPLASPAPTAHGGVSSMEKFTFCHTGGGTNCVVDGDTAWIAGVKIRIADIDAPETHPPRCAEEAKLGARATERLAELMNMGPFELVVQGRAEDRYGRQLRILVRGGNSIGEQLVDEGLARRWDGARHPWC